MVIQPTLILPVVHILGMNSYRRRNMKKKKSHHRVEGKPNCYKQDTDRVVSWSNGGFSLVISLFEDKSDK